MSKLYKVRREVEFCQTQEGKRTRTMVCEPHSETFYTVSSYQHLILQFFQDSFKSSRQCAAWLSEKHDVEIIEEDLSKFLENMRQKQILEYDFSSSVPKDTRANLSFVLMQKGLALVMDSGLSPSEIAAEKSTLRTWFHHLQSFSLLSSLSWVKFWAKQHINETVRQLYQSLAQSTEFLLARTLKDNTIANKLNMGMEAFGFFSPQGFFDRHHRIISLLMSPLSFVIFLILLIFSIFVLVYSPLMEWPRFQQYMFMGFNYYLSLFVLGNLHTAAHEFGHALVLHRLGGKVRKIGFLLFLGFMPTFYADVTDAYRLSRWRRTLVSLGGIMGQTVLGLAGLLIWHFLPPESYLALMCRFNTMMWLGAFVGNLLPFFRSDGYYILSDWIGMENLYAKTIDFFKNNILRAFGRTFEKIQHSAWELFWMLFYGLGTVLNDGVGLILGLAAMPVFFERFTLLPKIVMYIALLRLIFAALDILYTKLKKIIVSLRSATMPRKLSFSPQLRSVFWLSLAALIFFLPLPYSIKTQAKLCDGATYCLRLSFKEQDYQALAALGNSWTLSSRQQASSEHRLIYLSSQGDLMAKRRFWIFSIFPRQSQFSAMLEAPQLPKLGKNKNLRIKVAPRTLYQRWFKPLGKLLYVNWWSVF